VQSAPVGVESQTDNSEGTVPIDQWRSLSGREPVEAAEPPTAVLVLPAPEAKASVGHRRDWAPPRPNQASASVEPAPEDAAGPLLVWPGARVNGTHEPADAPPAESPVTPAHAEISTADAELRSTISQTGFVHLSPSIARAPDPHTTPARQVASPATARASHERTADSSSEMRPGTAIADRIRRLPVESYPIAFLLVLAVVMLLKPAKSGARHTEAPVSEKSRASLATAGTSVLGAFFATVGLAIVAVGATAIARAHFLHQPSFFRPGVTIAAIGQGVLLFGLIIVALRNGRSSMVNSYAGGGDAGVVQRAVPVLAASNAEQIRQLKAQLACLSQQLDDLTAPE
jgi:F0F1-type ATP synthase membrane subunit c/vacuolar-type H+-ATPase subunit K